MKINERIECADGFSMSVQGNSGAYCSPRIDNAEKYIEVEVGYARPHEELLEMFHDGDGIYPYVPRQVVVDIIAKHGGIVTGELPNGIPYIKAE